jgi:hypothetical protein
MVLGAISSYVPEEMCFLMPNHQYGAADGSANGPQQVIQKLLLLIAVISVPVLLLVKPLVLRKWTRGGACGAALCDPPGSYRLTGDS